MKRRKQAQPGKSARTLPRSHAPVPLLPWSPRAPRPTAPAAVRTSRARGTRESGSRSPALQQKWRHDSGSIHRSTRTLTAHAKRPPRRALRGRSAHSAPPVSPSYLLAPPRGSFTSSDFISYATTQTPRGFRFTGRSGAGARTAWVHGPGRWLRTSGA